MTEYKEYTVTTLSLADTDSVWDDLTSSLGSDTIPYRVVDVANERAVNIKNTSYFLTDEEASNLRLDSRVVAVENINQIPVFKYALQDSDFNKTASSLGAKGNWGLLRHIKTFNNYASSTADPGGTYDYVLDGTGVDIVIIDSGIQANHPEFTDSVGSSRVVEHDWFSVSGVPGSMPSGFYTDYDGHGTHVAGTIAGKNFGWAKNARIYSIKLEGLQGAEDPGDGLNPATAFDVLLGWHLNKPVPRPTILNNSWGFGVYWHVDLDSLSFGTSLGGVFYPITGGVYRENSWAGAVRDTAKGHTGSIAGDGIYQLPFRITSIDTDIATLISAGIVVCNAAGNEGCKVDVFGGIDYNNRINTSSGVIPEYYYHRGSSPSSGDNFGFEVGAFGTGVIGGIDRKSTFSSGGPGVDIYAAGANIISCYATNNLEGSTNSYFADSNFYQQSLSGTSMASPQIAGMCALLKQAHPDWTPRQIYNWMTSNAEPDMYTTSLDNDYSSTSSIYGGYNRLAYFPLAGQKYYQMTG
jgi:subtilisin family serine protease